MNYEELRNKIKKELNDQDNGFLSNLKQDNLDMEQYRKITILFHEVDSLLMEETDTLAAIRDIFYYYNEFFSEVLFWCMRENDEDMLYETSEELRSTIGWWHGVRIIY